MVRPNHDEYFMAIARVVSSRGTCISRRVGCVLVDKRNHIVATGYNGRAAGLDNCIDHQCARPKGKSGENLDKCDAIHAEQNALLQCGDVYEIDTVYVTASPCSFCIKLLMNTGARRIVFDEPYPGHNVADTWLLSRKDREWHQM